MFPLENEDILSKEDVVNLIKFNLRNVLTWTTLVCDWGTVNIEIPYKLSYSSAKQLWGYRYLVYNVNGTVVECNPHIQKEMELILIDLIERFCRTRWGNRVDGRETLYKYVPRSKIAFKH